MKRYMSVFLRNLSVIVFAFICINNSNAADIRNTIAAGSWSSLSTWNNVGTNAVPTKDDNVTINHSVNLDANWGPQNSGSIIFNATSSGSGTLNMTGGTIDINANVTLTGTGINLNGGTIYVRSGYTLTMPGLSEANTDIVVEEGATVIINGDLLNNHGSIDVDGLITVTGNYNGQAGDAIVTGDGNITSVGSMSGINGSSIFNTINPYCPSNCDGRNLFGGGTCTGTATAVPNVTSICSGATVSFTSTLTGGYGSGFTKKYQWQIKNSSNVFVNISNATNSTYSASPSVSSTYRVIIGEKLNSGDAYCYKSSAGVSISVTPSATVFAGTPISVCEGSGAINITAGASAANYSNISWSATGSGTFASSGSLTSATYTPSAADITAGTITLTLTATNAACGNKTATKTLTIKSLPSVTSVTPGTTCGTGAVTVTLSATSNFGTLNWYAGSSGGVILGSGTTFNPSISVTTVFYVEASNLGCSSARTAVTATVDNGCTYTWTGTTSKVWNVGSNWSAGYVPTSLNNVIIPSSVASGNMPEISTASVSKSLSNAGTITFTNAGALSVYGNISNTGTITTVAGSTINMIGSSPQTISGLPSVYDLSINNSSGVSLSSVLTVKGTVSLISGVLTTNDHLTLNFDTGGNIAYHSFDAGSVSGNVSGIRNLAAKSHYISAPFAGVTSGQIDASTPIYRSANGVWLMASKRFDNQSWTFIKNYTTTLSLISGYSLGMFDPASLKMTGTYNHGASYSSGDYANTIPSTATEGAYFMVGNPYPSTLDWESTTGWTKTNIDDAIYFWNPVNSSVSSYVDGVGTNGATQFIPAMQAFLVKTTGTGGMASVLVNNNARILANASYFRSSSNQLVRLAVRNAAGTLTDETVVRLDDLSSADFESDVDACKISGSLSLYTKNTGGETDYSINTLPLSGPEILVPLNLKVAGNGIYTIECKEYSVPGYSLVLEDKKTQSYTVMDNSTIYTINASSADSVNRFVLRFVAGLTTGVRSGNSVDLQISTYDNQMMLNTAGIQTNNATINVYSASGLNVLRFDGQNIEPGIQTLGLPGLTSGVYIVKVEIEGTMYVGKVVLK